MLSLVLSLLLAACAPNGSPSAELAAADEAFSRMDYPAAIGGYESLLQQNPNDPELLWKAARAHVCLGEPFEDGRRREHCLKAEQLARRCIAVRPDIGEGHTWLAGALGYIALDESMSRQAALSSEILAEVDHALALNPRDDAALSIKGSLFRALGNVTWLRHRMAALFLGGLPAGGFEEGEAALKQAIAIAPDVMRHHYELGVLYLDMGKLKEAREALQHVLVLHVKVAIDLPRQAKARVLLEQLGAEK